MSGEVWAPEFYLIGSMKSGTSSLHAMLDHHPQLFLPRGEAFFFDLDDFIDHPDFFSRGGDAWHTPDFDREFSRYLEWYQELFAAAPAGCLRGEDSTTYLSSPIAPSRIARYRPDARLIVMLREPVARCYSHYWHLVRHGRAHYSFEDMLRLSPEQLLRRGLYQQHLARYRQWFPAEQILVLLFEELVASPAESLDRVCAFLGVEPLRAEAALTVHANRGQFPRHPGLRLWRNRLLWKRELRNFMQRMPWTYQPPRSWQEGRWGDWIDRVHRRVNPNVRARPPMAPETRSMLTQFLQRENAALAKEWSLDLNRWWRWHD